MVSVSMAIRTGIAVGHGESHAPFVTPMIMIVGILFYGRGDLGDIPLSRARPYTSHFLHHDKSSAFMYVHESERVLFSCLCRADTVQSTRRSASALWKATSDSD